MGKCYDAEKEAQVDASRCAYCCINTACAEKEDCDKAIRSAMLSLIIWLLCCGTCCAGFVSVIVWLFRRRSMPMRSPVTEFHPPTGGATYPYGGTAFSQPQPVGQMPMMGTVVIGRPVMGHPVLPSLVIGGTSQSVTANVIHVGSPPASSGGWMSTAAPSGQSWQMFCNSSPVEIDGGTGYLKGAWGECLCWAKAYELQTPQWSSSPQYAQSGPAGQAAQAAITAGPPRDKEFIEQACDNLEKACEAATAMGQALPLIGLVIRR
ncbi:unnamed protein product [Polarella glacialis]|uniref:Uncharacterized protein n=1 Tax=Polarella glacialis TaxID=89957 RepID=A0A813IF12_POLGL|nr:unnamed protein product [Polarella glacialis]